MAADITCLTVIRRGKRENVKFVDDFWDYQMHRCLREGLYWAYEQNVRKLVFSKFRHSTKGVKKYASMRQVVAWGTLPPPEVSWVVWMRVEWDGIVSRARQIEEARKAWEKEKARKEADEWLERNFG